MMGPPSDAPKRLILNGGKTSRLGFCRFGLLASDQLDRRNSYTLPCQAFPPDRVWAMTTPESACPVSASKLWVVIRMSASDSKVELITVSWLMESRLSVPSSCPAVALGR